MPGNVDLIPMSTSRLWGCRLALAYQRECEAIFYPGPHWADELGMKVRRFFRKRAPLITTIEGVIAGPDALKDLAGMAGHPVFSQPGVDRALPRIRRIYQACDHIIAISPFLARVAKTLYGDKVSCLPIGVEASIFHDRNRREPERPRVVGCGTVKSSKRPELFLSLAARYPDADFVWFGDGPGRQALVLESERKTLANLQFPGSLPPEAVAEEFRCSSLFVLPSQAEGVPKVTQEAAACGLPVVALGFYESPSVVHQANGLVAWSDEELIGHVGILLDDPETRRRMGRRGAEMAKAWDWDSIAPQWEDLVIRLATS
jgi:glycosyltransferase involved in cell wall biosynthesis